MKYAMSKLYAKKKEIKKSSTHTQIYTHAVGLLTHNFTFKLLFWFLWFTAKIDPEFTESWVDYIFRFYRIIKAV